MKRLRVNKHILHVLRKSKPNLRKALIKQCEPDVIKTLCEICLNTLKGNTRLSNVAKKRLKKYKRTIRSLSQPKQSVAFKRKVLLQHGGFLPLLLGTLLSGVIGKLLN